MLFILFGLTMVTCAGLTLFAGSIVTTKHNLSTSGAGGIRAVDTSEICIFCHTTHSGRSYAPLWNRDDSPVVYTLYDSSTLHSTPGQPDGASKLCLSCHDGTIALGNVISRTDDFDMTGTLDGKIPGSARSNLGIDISDDHPVSFDATSAVGASSELTHPPLGDSVRYDAGGKIQCTSCHNPHDGMYGCFLVKNNQGASICKTCHEPTGFAGTSTHDVVPSTWDGTGEDPWPNTPYSTVNDNSCMNCHWSHNAGGNERLLRSNVEETVCLVCHNGSVGADIENVLAKTSSHRVSFYQGIHDPVENIESAAKHVECADCHNPHRLNGTNANAPNVNGRLAGVSGMTVTGSMRTTAQYEYEVCLKCHGQDRYRVTTSISRMMDTDNIRIAINPSNASFHALAAQGTSNYVPSLIPPYTTSSRLYCTDCHNSNSSVNAGGTGANGPHGSSNEYLLERYYATADYTSWSEANYALCFKCHNPNIILNNSVSPFARHASHIVTIQAPCSVCHDPHGSPNHVGLLNFDTNVVFPNRNGELKFEIIGDRGYCYMECHGSSHNPKSYRRR